ncbi:Fe-S protein assembly chaperone HscA [Bacteroidia bacterium]|nr:Fe-S protein assembly chaperone HscA [Bacteroidia bacterium]
MGRIPINIKDGTLKKTCIVGIDLGTTNSLIAYINESGEAEIIGDAKHLLVPSVIHISKQGEVTVGEGALPYLIQEPENTIYSVKRFLGKSYEDMDNQNTELNYSIVDDGSDSLVKVKIHDRYYSPIELSAEILKELKRKAEKSLNAEISGAVITVPAYFNDAQRQATRDAGKIAGINVLRIVNEPTAASLAYGINQVELNRCIAVYDLGGGTFDISILKIEDGIFEVLSTHGNTALGGDDFDRAIINFWLKESDGLAALLKTNAENSDLLKQQAKEAKETLSTSKTFQTSFNYLDTSFNLSITQDQFNALIAPLIEKTVHSCKEALKDAEIGLDEVEEVVMVGGSTRIPLVLNKITRFFHKSAMNNQLDPDQVVALGATIEADILAGNRKDVVLLDVTPLSLGIEMVGGLMDVIIPRNSKVPTMVGKEYTTSVDGQVNLKVTIYQGERELVKDNRKLAEFTLSNIPAMPAGFPKIEIKFMLNADGILNVSAHEERSGMQQEIIVKPSYGLTDQEVEEMLKASIENASEDITLRLNEETKNEAEQLIYLTQRFIENNSSILTPKEIQETETMVAELKELLQKDESRDAISKAIEALNDYTRPFAERLMDKAVKSALHGKKIL